MQVNVDQQLKANYPFNKTEPFWLSLFEQKHETLALKASSLLLTKVNQTGLKWHNFHFWVSYPFNTLEMPHFWWPYQLQYRCL